jgi:hypothetical protein
MTDGYIAFVLDEESRQKLLKTFPPKYADVIAHHITYAYGVSDKEPLPPQPQKIVVRGYHDSGAIQVLIVEIDGRKNQALDENNFYHITLSLDRSQGVEPKNSNDVLQKIVAAAGEGALYNLPEPIEISAVPAFINDEPATAQKAKIFPPKLQP